MQQSISVIKSENCSEILGPGKERGKIALQKQRTHLVGDTEQASGFRFRETAASKKRSAEAGAHGKAAEKTKQKNAASGRRVSCESPAERFCFAQKWKKRLRVRQQMGEDDKGKQRGKNSVKPQIHTGGGSSDCFSGRQQEKTKQRKEQKKGFFVHEMAGLCLFCLCICLAFFK